MPPVIIGSIQSGDDLGLNNREREKEGGRNYIAIIA